MTTVHRLTVVVCLALLACGKSADKPGPNVTDLESSLSTSGGAVGPGAAAMVSDIKEILEDRDAVVVKVMPGTPRKIAVLIRFPDLANVDMDERRAYIEDIGEILSEDHDAAGDRIAVGIRGKLFYGAVGTRAPSEDWTIDVGASVSTASVEELLAAASPPADS